MTVPIDMDMSPREIIADLQCQLEEAKSKLTAYRILLEARSWGAALGAISEMEPEICSVVSEHDKYLTESLQAQLAAMREALVTIIILYAKTYIGDWIEYCANDSTIKAISSLLANSSSSVETWQRERDAKVLGEAADLWETGSQRFPQEPAKTIGLEFADWLRKRADAIAAGRQYEAKPNQSDQQEAPPAQR